MPGLDYSERKTSVASRLAANQHQAAVAKPLPLVAAMHLRVTAAVQTVVAPARRSLLTLAADVALRRLLVL